MNPTVVWPDLTPMQADGHACVICCTNYLTARGRASVPVGYSRAGSQVFACVGACEQAATDTVIVALPRPHRRQGEQNRWDLEDSSHDHITVTSLPDPKDPFVSVVTREHGPQPRQAMAWLTAAGARAVAAALLAAADHIESVR